MVNMLALIGLGFVIAVTIALIDALVAVTLGEAARLPFWRATIFLLVFLTGFANLPPVRRWLEE